jgi:hypothetical protein
LQERFIAHYGNLLLEVLPRLNKQEPVFDYVVTDKADGFVCWSGSASNLATAQSDAISEAQIFLDPFVANPPEPQWIRDDKPDTQE